MMTNDGRTVAATLAGQVVALDMGHAAGLLQVALPHMAAEDGAMIAERGERFTIRNGQAVVPVRGILTPNSYALERWLGWTTYHGLIDTMAQVSALDHVQGVVLLVDSPGGLVMGCADAAQAVAEVAARMPVRALCDPLCASAAYWITSQATEIHATAGAVIGSIGIAGSGRYPVQPGGNGWQDWALTSSHARAKMHAPETDARRALLQADLDESEAAFHAAVAAGRGIDVAQLRAQLSMTDDPADGGGAWYGAEAQRRGLVDSVTPAAAFWAALDAARPAPRRVAQSRRARATLARLRAT